MPKTTRTLAARRDLVLLTSDIAKLSGSRTVALRFIERLNERFDLYARESLMGEACPRLGHDVRCFTFGSYVAYYRPTSGGIQVLRVIHGSRNLPTAWRNQN